MLIMKTYSKHKTYINRKIYKKYMPYTMVGTISQNLIVNVLEEIIKNKTA